MSNDDFIRTRDLLDVALGDKDPEDVKISRNSGTFLDRLPKDILQYLYHYTDPIDCFYLTHVVHDNQGRRIPSFHVWVDKTLPQALQEARNKGFWNNQITQAQIIFMEGKPYLIQQVEKNQLYGIKKSKRRLNLQKKGGSIYEYSRCTAKTNSGKRCKNRTSNKSGKCTTHDRL